MSAKGKWQDCAGIAHLLEMLESGTLSGLSPDEDVNQQQFCSYITDGTTLWYRHYTRE